jgi:hypothetical protein
MTAEAVFSIANLVAVAGWLLLIAVPRNRRATTVAGTIIPLLKSEGLVRCTLRVWLPNPKVRAYVSGQCRSWGSTDSIAVS